MRFTNQTQAREFIAAQKRRSNECGLRVLAAYDYLGDTTESIPAVDLSMSTTKRLLITYAVLGALGS